jgi:hypothetical protein
MSETANTRGTHPVSVTHLVMGLVFLGASALWALTETGVVELTGARWIGPLVLVVAGLVGLLVSVGRGLRHRRSEDASEEDVMENQILE